MKNNWNKAINEINKNRFTIPAGWDTKEKIAEELQCAPDRVADLLKPGLQAGEFERQDFPVWDEARRLTTRVTCYRQVTDETKTPPVQDRETGRVLRALKKHPKLSDYEISRKASSSSKKVAEIRKKI